MIQEEHWGGGIKYRSASVAESGHPDLPPLWQRQSPGTPCYTAISKQLLELRDLDCILVSKTGQGREGAI